MENQCASGNTPSSSGSWRQDLHIICWDGWPSSLPPFLALLPSEAKSQKWSFGTGSGRETTSIEGESHQALSSSQGHAQWVRGNNDGSSSVQSHLILNTTLWRRYYCYPCLQIRRLRERDDRLCLKVTLSVYSEAGFEPWQSDSRVLVFYHGSMLPLQETLGCNSAGGLIQAAEK